MNAFQFPASRLTRSWNAPSAVSAALTPSRKTSSPEKPSPPGFRDNAKFGDLGRMTRTVTILGATGSVGQSTLDLIERNAERYEVLALTARQDVAGLAAAARRVDAKRAVIAEESLLGALREALAGTGIAGWIAMMIFIGELALGLAYAWKKGALDWE